MPTFRIPGHLLLASAMLVAPLPLGAQETARTAELTYADIVDLADEAPLVLRAQIRKQATVEPERSPGLEPGFVRLYIEARTSALIAGNVPVGGSLRYLVDVPLDAKGKAPKLKKQEVVLFARPVREVPINCNWSIRGPVRLQRSVRGAPAPGARRIARAGCPRK